MTISCGIIICAIILNQFLSVSGDASCKDEIVDNTVEVLFNKNGNILFIDEWNDKESDDKFKSVMAEQATILCSISPHECSLIAYNATTHPFKESSVVFTDRTPSFANGYIAVKFYIKLTGILEVFPGAVTFYVIQKSALINMTKNGVADLNSTLGFTTSFIDGELIAGGVDYSMEKIVLPITFIVFLILLIVVYGCEKTHDEIEELKRRHGYGSRTKVSPGIEMHKVDNECEIENHHITHGDDPQKHQQFSADSSESSCDDIDSSGFNPDTKYNNSVYGHHGHVPRIGLPTGPTPYAYPRRSFKVKNTEEETPPPGYDELQQDAIPVQEPPALKQTVQEPSVLESVVEPPAVPPAIQPSTPVKQPPPPTKRLPPLIAVSNPDAVEKLNGIHQPMEAAPVITRGHRKKKPNKASLNGAQAPAEEISQPVAKDTPPSDTEMFVELQTNASKSPNSEVREAPKKKHKKLKKKKHRHNTGEEEEEELCGDDEMLQKRKKHRKKKKKKHRHRHSDEDDDENER